MSSGPNKSIYGKGEERSGGKEEEEEEKKMMMITQLPSLWSQLTSSLFSTREREGKKFDGTFYS